MTPGADVVVRAGIVGFLIAFRPVTEVRLDLFPAERVLLEVALGDVLA